MRGISRHFLIGLFIAFGPAIHPRAANPQDEGPDAGDRLTTARDLIKVKLDCTSGVYRDVARCDLKFKR